MQSEEDSKKDQIYSPAVVSKAAAEERTSRRLFTPNTTASTKPVSVC